MKRYNKWFIFPGILFLVFSLVEWILCFYGPVVLEVKSTIFVYPLFSLKEDADAAAIRQAFTDKLSRSRRYIVISRDRAEKILAEGGKTLAEWMKRPSSDMYAEAAKQIGAEKFTMGYIYQSTTGYEIFINVHLTKQAESVIKESITAPDARSLIAKMGELINKLDGEKKGYALPEMLFFIALFLHALFGLFLVIRPFLETFAGHSRLFNRITAWVSLRGPEILLIYTLLLFIFSYIYALNANMDYVQKFMATSGNLHLAQSTTQERINAAIRYFPLLGLTGFCFTWFRLKREELGLAPYIKADFRVLWALPFTLLSAFLASLALPSFLDINGWPVLAYISLIPFLLLIEKNSYPAGVCYGIIFGTYYTVFTSYWLGTFSLVSLQIVMMIFVVSYAVFMIPGVLLYKLAGRLRFLVFPAGWVVFDYLQSVGFAGYPWSMFGVSQYSFLPLIQTAALTGVWGLTFIVVLVNSGLAHVINSLLEKNRKGRFLPLYIAGGLFAVALTGGWIYLGITSHQNPGRGTVRVAQVQDSMDPRKHSTGEVMEVLEKLTNEVLKDKPDIVAWPEGSFNTDYQAFPNNFAVQDLKAYQQTTGTWLLTGTVDFEDKELARTVRDSDEELVMYNATMLLDPAAEVHGVYGKIHLVPFTEYFPYKKELPWMYKMLKEFDINWWGKGKDRVIFQHPRFSFFTPICYEDVFPGEIARFVYEGADVIMNLSNDFWSLSPVEGKQHAIDSLFRAVENARPLLRTTTSGLTCYVDINGRIKKTLPYYKPGYYVVDVPLPGKGKTFYTMIGDLFPWILYAGLATLLLVALIMRAVKKFMAGKKSTGR